MHFSSILVTEGVPISDMLAIRFSIYAFLSMKPGNINPSLLPGEELKDIFDPQRFVRSIQWFFANLFGIKRGPMTFMYRVLIILHLCL